MYDIDLLTFIAGIMIGMTLMVLAVAISEIIEDIHEVKKENRKK